MFTIHIRAAILKVYVEEIILAKDKLSYVDFFFFLISETAKHDYFHII